MRAYMLVSHAAALVIVLPGRFFNFFRLDPHPNPLPVREGTRTQREKIIRE